jgi:hypothetical protein
VRETLTCLCHPSGAQLASGLVVDDYWPAAFLRINMTDLEEILREALSRGSLIDNHPDLASRPQESRRDKQFQPIRSFHNPQEKNEDWRTQSEQAQSGYSNPVDDPEYKARHWGKQ